MSQLAAARKQYPHLNDYTDQELLGIIAKQNNITPDSPMYKRIEDEVFGYKRSAGEAVKDAAVGLGQGVASVAGAVGAAVGRQMVSQGETIDKVGGALGLGLNAATRAKALNAYDNPIVNAASDAREWAEQFKSEGLRNREAGSQLAVDVAGKEAKKAGAGMMGVIDAEAKAKLGSYVDNPQIAAQDIISNIPQMVGPAVVGRMAQAGALASGIGAKAAGRIGLAGGVGTGGYMQGADIGRETYQRAIKEGATPEAAAALADTAALKAGAATVALSLTPLGGTIERSMLRGAASAGAGRGLGAVTGRVVAGAGEAVSEALEEGYGAFAGNQAIKQVNPNTDLAAGVGSAAVQGAAAGGPMGAVMAHGTAKRTASGEIDLVSPPVRVEPTLGTQDVPRETPTATGAGTIMVTRDGTALPPQSAEQMERLEQVRQFNDGVPTLTDQIAPADGVPVLTERLDEPVLTDVLAPADGIPVLTDRVEGMPEVPTLTDTLAPADGIPVLTNEVENPARPNKGKLLTSLQESNKELGKTFIKKDGGLAGNRAAAPLREVLEAKDPLGKIRELHQDGSAPRDELLDTWHKKLTGQTVFDWKKAQTPVLNDAGFVPEPAAQVAAQVAAVQDGRKDVAVLGPQEAAAANLDGLASAEAKDATGATAVVVSQDPAKVKQAVARAAEVGIKQAMGEALGVANPTLTSEADPGAKVVQQVDDATGEVIMEELATEADLPNVQQVPGTTARVVTPEQALADRQAAAPSETAKKSGSLKFGRKPTDELIDISDNTKDEAEYEQARYELYKRWAEGDEKADAYLTEGFDVSTGKGLKRFLDRPEIKAFKLRHDTELKEKGAKKAQKLGEKFGVVKAARAGNPDVGKSRALAGRPKTAVEAAQWLRDNALSGMDRTIAGKIAPNLEGVDIVWVDAGADVPAQVAEFLNANARAVSALDPATGEVTIYARNDVGAFEDVLLHEMVHAASQNALEDPANAALRGQLEKLRKTIGHALSREAYNMAHDADRAEMGNFFMRAIDDAHELLAYAYTSPSLRPFLESIDANGNPLPKTQPTYRMDTTKPNAFQRLVNLVRGMLNLPPYYHTRVQAIMTNAGGAPVGTSIYAKLDEGFDAVLAATGAPADVAHANVSSVFAKPFADVADAARAAVRAQTRGTEISPKVLSLMTLRQIAEQFGDKLPAMRPWIAAIMERSTNASKLAAEADRVALEWEQGVKDPAERAALAEVFLRASVAELELDNVTQKYLSELSAEQRREHAALRAKLEALSPESQRTRKQALAILKRQWEYTRDSLESFINHTVADPGLRSARIEQLKTELGRNRGDYFPLSRFGSRIVVARNAAADGRDVVSFHETAAAAEAEVAKWSAAGKKVTVNLKSEYDRTERAATGFIGEIHKMIDGADTDPSVKDSMHEALQQLFLKSMPELAGAKAMIRRENIEGFSRDALRAFADSVTRGSRYASQLEFAPAIQAAREAAEAQSRSSESRVAAVVIGRKDGEKPVVVVVPAGTERLNAVNRLNEQGYATEFSNKAPETVKEHLAGALEGVSDAQIDAYAAEVEAVVGRTSAGVEDLRAAKALYNHMIKLQQSEKNEDAGAVLQALGQVGYVWYLGLSPAFWAMNTLQNPMIGIPHLGAKYGAGAAAAEWGATAKWFAGVRIGKRWGKDKTPFSVEWLKEEAKAGKLKGITKDELDMLQDLQDRQVLDFTQSMDLNRISQASGSTVYKAMRFVAAGAHHTEVFNRVTFALSAYRLALKSDTSVTHAQAVTRAESDTAAVHFDYSFANKPALMRGKVSRLMFMFQQYRQHMLYWWVNNTMDSVKGESKEVRQQARKAMLLMGATQGVFAGAMGLPFVGSIAFLANLLASDDDDGVPFDFNRWITEAASDTMGKEAGEVFAKGIFAAVGMNISQRIGQADLMPLLNQSSAAKYERNTDDKVRAYAYEMAGPLGSLALTAARGLDAFERGDTLTGVATIAPKFIGDLLKAGDLASEGAKNSRGELLATAEAFDGWDVAMQAAGIVPTAVANIKADGAKVRSMEAAITKRTRELTGQFVEAWSRGDQEGLTSALADIQKFNGVMSTKYQDPALLIDRRQLEGAIKDRQNRALILAVSGGTAETKRQLQMAQRASGLFNPVTPESIREKAAGLR